jgi:hypothetical protein
VAKTRGALTGFLRAYGEKFPDIGKFAGQCAETVNRRSAELEVQFAIAKLQRIAHSGAPPQLPLRYVRIRPIDLRVASEG